MAEVSSARDVFSGVVKGLQQEAAARRKAVEELKAQLAKQVGREGKREGRGEKGLLLMNLSGRKRRGGWQLRSSRCSWQSR